MTDEPSLSAWAEDCRSRGLGALQSASFEGLDGVRREQVVKLDDALDILDRQIDNLLDRIASIKRTL